MESGANGAKSLEDKEWESLLLYSYILRSVAHSNSDIAVDASVRQVQGQKAVATGESKLFERRCWGCYSPSSDTSHMCPAEAGPRGWQVLRDTSSGIIRNENGNHARRPSSAPVKRAIDKAVLCEGSHRLSHRQPMAITSEISCGRAHQSVSHGSWGEPETEDLRKGLVR